MINEPIALALAVAAGGALGAFFFGGLWWTVARGLMSATPAAWFFGSLLLRTGLTALGFALVAHGHWERMLACLVGFFVARIAVTRLTRTSAAAHAGLAEGADHASQS